MAQKRCNLCFSVIGKGKPHNCNSESRFQNLTDCILQTPSKTQSQILSSVIKEKFNENEENRDSHLSLSQIHGPQFHVAVEKKIFMDHSLKRPVLSTEDLVNIKTDLNLSNRAITSIASSLRVAANNRKIVEPGLKSKLFAKAHSVDDYFSCKQFEFVKVKGNKVSDATAVAVYCNDIPAFIQHIKEQRRVSEVHLKLGIDGGGGFLKICLSVQTTSDVNMVCKTERSKYDEGVAAKRFKDSGVKKLVILALASNSQENFENVSQLWTQLNISAFDGTIATDLKMANILVGIMSHSSSFPCTWCYAKKESLHVCGQLRSSRNVLENYENWRAAGALKDRAKNFFNCIHPPLITTTEDKNLLEIIPPPELHLMLGVVNTVFTHMLKEFETESLAWAESCYVQREITHGNPAFKGNSCKKLLENVDILRGKKNLGLMKYVKVFDDFRKVTSACFGNDLKENYSECIQAFKKSYVDLGVNITPKVHAVFFHVEQFCAIKGVSLGFFSEQAMESVHFDFKTTWEKNKVSVNHPDYPEKLLRSVCSYNSLHV